MHSNASAMLLVYYFNRPTMKYVVAADAFEKNLNR